MRRSILVTTIVALAAFALAPSALAQCSETLKTGTTFGFVVDATDKTITGKGTAKVVKNDGAYLEFEVAVDKGKMTMPGGIDGNRIIVTNPSNGNVWVATCSATGFEGSSMLAGKSMKLKATKLK